MSAKHSYTVVTAAPLWLWAFSHGSDARRWTSRFARAGGGFGRSDWNADYSWIEPFITPIAQIPLSAAACVVLRANVPVAIVATLVNTPPTFGPVYYAAWKVGAWVLAEPVDAAHTPELLARAASQVASAPAAQASAATPQALLPSGDADAVAASWWQRAVQAVQGIGKPLLVGTLIFSFGFSALAWLLCNTVWHWRVRRKRRRRLAAAAATRS
jgi:uncharacterized protein (DUF2062 family)